MFGFLRRKRVRLLAMRLADMLVLHPETKVVQCCKCGHDIGLYPSGQAVMRNYGKRCEVVCQVCEKVTGGYQPAPGALAEFGQGVRRQ